MGIFLDIVSSSTRTAGPHGGAARRTCWQADETDLAAILGLVDKLPLGNQNCIKKIGTRRRHPMRSRRWWSTRRRPATVGAAPRATLAPLAVGRVPATNTRCAHRGHMFISGLVCGMDARVLGVRVRVSALKGPRDGGQGGRSGPVGAGWQAARVAGGRRKVAASGQAVGSPGTGWCSLPSFYR